MQLLSAKYLSDTHIFHNPINRGASYSWQSILKAVDFLKWGFINRVGRGNISLWYERWLHKGRLCDMVPYVHISDINLQISDLCVSDTWHFDHLNTILPLDVRLEMQSLMSPRMTFSFRSLLARVNIQQRVLILGLLITMRMRKMTRTTILWNWVWHLKIPENVKHFAWLIMHDSLPCNDF